MTTRRRNASARGAAFERRVALATEGEVYDGTAGDVDALGFRIEAKYRSNLRGYGELKGHITQAIDNGKLAGKPWVLVIGGGVTFRNDEKFAVLPLAKLVELAQSAGHGDAWEWLQRAMKAVIKETVA